MKHATLVRVCRGTLAVGLLFASSLTGNASPLRMDYIVNPSGGGYSYDFRLILDNSDSSWSPGQGWNWLIFGDKQGGPSALADFKLSPGTLAVGPFSTLTRSAGGHNGPTFAPLRGAHWTPSGVGDMLQWSGTSSGFLDDGQLLFSSLMTSGGASGIYLQPANRVSSFTTGSQSVPDGGSTVLLLGACFGGLVFAGKRSKKAAGRTENL